MILYRRETNLIPFYNTCMERLSIDGLSIERVSIERLYIVRIVSLKYACPNYSSESN